MAAHPPPQYGAPAPHAGATPAPVPVFTATQALAQPSRFKATTDLGSAAYHSRAFVADSPNLGVLRHRMWVPKAVEDYDESAAIIASIGIPERS